MSEDGYEWLKGVDFSDLDEKSKDMLIKSFIIKIAELEKKNEKHLNWHIDFYEKWKERIEKLEKLFEDHNRHHKSLNSGELKFLWLNKELSELKGLKHVQQREINELKEQIFTPMHTLTEWKISIIDRIIGVEEVLRELHNRLKLEFTNSEIKTNWKSYEQTILDKLGGDTSVPLSEGLIGVKSSAALTTVYEENGTLGINLEKTLTESQPPSNPNCERCTSILCEGCRENPLDFINKIPELIREDLKQFENPSEQEYIIPTIKKGDPTSWLGDSNFPPEKEVAEDDFPPLHLKGHTTVSITYDFDRFSLVEKEDLELIFNYYNGSEYGANGENYLRLREKYLPPEEEK